MAVMPDRDYAVDDVEKRWEFTGLLDGVKSASIKRTIAEKLENKMWDLVAEFQSDETFDVVRAWEDYLNKLKYREELPRKARMSYGYRD